jgi:hypothetical protein
VVLKELTHVIGRNRRLGSMCRYRRQRRSQPALEALETRIVPQATLYIDYGDRFPNGVLADKVGRFDASSGNHVVLGPDIDRPGDDAGTFGPDTDFTLTNFNAIYGSIAASYRAKILEIARRAYDPVNIRVVELTSEFQNVNGHQVRAAGTLDDVAATLAVNDNDPQHHDAYVFACRIGVGPDGYSPTNIGKAHGDDIPDTGDNSGPGNRRDGLAFTFLAADARDSFGRLASSGIIHEAGHLFGLRHGPTADPSDPPTGVQQAANALARHEIMGYQRDTPWDFRGYFTRYPMVAGNSDLTAPGSYDQLAAAVPPAPPDRPTLYDQLVNDPEVGPNPAYEYITGTGANNIITIGEYFPDATKALVTVQAFLEAGSDFSFTNAIPVPGGDGGSRYSYVVDLNRDWVIDTSVQTNRILLDFDSPLASANHKITLRGMSGTNQLLILGKAGLSGVYTPAADNPTDVYGNTERRGTIAIGATTIKIEEFDALSSINIQDVNQFSFNAPSGGAANLSLSANQAGQQEIFGTVGGGKGFVRLTLTNANDLFIRGSADSANIFGVNDAQMTRISLFGGGAGNTFTVADTAGNGSLSIFGGGADDRVTIASYHAAGGLRFDGAGGVDRLNVNSFAATSGGVEFNGGGGADELRLLSYGGADDVLFNGNEGDDTLVVNFDHGPRPVVFDGGDDNDTLEVNGDGSGALTTSSLTGVTSAPITWKNDPVTVENFVIHNGPSRSVSFNSPFLSGSTYVLDGGTLHGAGFIGPLRVESGSSVKPGTPQFLAFGTLHTEDFRINNGSLFTEISGSSALRYDRVRVFGSATLVTAYLNVTLDSAYLPPAGTVFTIIDNDGTDAIAGTFSGYPEGSVLSLNGGATNLRLGYRGGDGNDLTLTVVDNRPSIGSLSVSPGTIKDDNSDLVTVTANNVFSPDGRIDDVAFYLDNGNGVFDPNSDRLLGTDATFSVSTYSYSGPITGVTPGTYTLFARAHRYTFHDELFSDPMSTTIQVSAAPPPPQVASRDGPETRINSATANAQTRAIVGTDASGNLVAVFADNFNSALVQRYAEAGAAVGANSLLASVTTNLGDVAVARDGSFVAVWDASNNLFAQRYAADGSALGSVIQVSTSGQLLYGGSTGSGRIGMNERGDFIVAWVEGGYFDEDVYYRRYAADGTALDMAPARVNADATGAQRAVDVALDDSGTAVFTWVSATGSFPYALKARRLVGGTNLTGEFQVTTATGTNGGDLPVARVAATPGGDFVVAFATDQNKIFARRYRASGEAIDPQEFQVNTSLASADSPQIAVAPNGYFVIAWNAYAQDAGDGNFDRGVYGQVFGPNGNKLGGPIHVSTTESGDQSLTGLAMAPDGSFTAAWSGNGPGDSNGVFLQRFNVNRAPTPGSLPTQLVGANSQRVISVTLADPDQDPVIVTQINGQAVSLEGAVELPSGARVTLNDIGILTYEPRGALAVGALDTFIYTLSDGTLSATASVNLRITQLITVADVTPSVATGILPVGVSPLQIRFTEPVALSGDPNNYRLQESGTDRLLGTADDVIVARTLTADDITATLGGVGLSAGLYRLTVLDAITDAAGQRLDGNRNGTPGGQFIRDFVVASGSLETLLAPSGAALDVVGTGSGAGQLLHGGSNALDGVNRLQVGGQDFAPLLPPVVLTTATLGSPLFPIVDGSYRDTGFTTTFTSDGSPVRLGALIQMTNMSATQSILEVDFRFTIDGLAIGQERYDTLLANGYDEVVLEHFLSSPASGTHEIGIQWRDRVDGTSVRIDAGSSIQIEQYRAQSDGSPAVDIFSASFASSTPLPNGSDWRDVGDHLTIMADGSPLRLSASVQVASTSSTFAVPQVQMRLMVDGVPIGVERWETLPASGYLGTYLEDSVAALAPGPHTIGVQARVSSDDPSVNINAGSTINAVQFRNRPGGAAAAMLYSTSAPEYSFPAADNVYHHVAPSYTFISAGSQAAVSAIVQITNMNSQAVPVGQVYARLTLDDVPLGEEHYVYLPANGNRQIVLSALVNDVAAGEHRVGVQVRNPFADTSIRVDYQSSLQVIEYLANPAARRLDEGQTIVTPTQTLAGLEVHREVTVPADGSIDFARTIEVLHNPTGADIATTVRLVGNLGSGPATSIFATSDGDTTPEVSDEWIGTHGGTTPPVIHYLHGPAGLLPASVTVSGDNVAWTFAVTVPAGQTMKLGTLTILADTAAAASTAAGILVTPTAFADHAADFLSAADQRALANFQFPTATAMTLSSNHAAGAAYGQVVTITAVVGAVDTAAGTPTGSVQLSVDGNNVGSPVALTAGSAEFLLPATLGAGDHIVSATYTSDGQAFTGSATTAPFTQTVTRAPLTVSADDQGKVYGAAMPNLTLRFAGFVNGDTAASLDTAPIVTTTATAASDVGSYSITPSAAADANYDVTFAPATMTVTRAPLVITADNKTMVAGTALPTLTVQFSGFVNGDGTASLDAPLLIATTANASSPPGTYPITVTAAARNYEITIIAGTLTITPAPQPSTPLPPAPLTPTPPLAPAPLPPAPPPALALAAPRVLKANGRAVSFRAVSLSKAAPDAVITVRVNTTAGQLRLRMKGLKITGNNTRRLVLKGTRAAVNRALKAMSLLLTRPRARAKVTLSASLGRLTRATTIQIG